MQIKPIVLIPAYCPDEGLEKLSKDLSELDMRVIVVDDGSGPGYAQIFERVRAIAGCSVLEHEQNQGKGAALKSAIREALRLAPDGVGVITADADGQHLPEDILKIAAALMRSPDSLVLGARDFSGSNAPFKSRWGNRITSAVFHWATGARCLDTQTGLRGLPMAFAEECLEVPGGRYEFEMNALLCAAEQKRPIVEVPIQTIYLNDNCSSHFRTIRDSARIYAGFLRFGASSLCCALTDLLLFSALANLLFNGSAVGILCATVLARICSGLMNFTINKKWVFRDERRGSAGLGLYLAVFVSQMLTSWLLVSALSAVLPNLTLAKALVDVCLFFVSYHAQKRFVFHAGRCRRSPKPEV